MVMVSLWSRHDLLSNREEQHEPGLVHSGSCRRLLRIFSQCQCFALVKLGWAVIVPA